MSKKYTASYSMSLFWCSNNLSSPCIYVKVYVVGEFGSRTPRATTWTRKIRHYVHQCFLLYNIYLVHRFSLELNNIDLKSEDSDTFPILDRLH
jgi:hypothetical protein